MCPHSHIEYQHMYFDSYDWHRTNVHRSEHTVLVLNMAGVGHLKPINMIITPGFDFHWTIGQPGPAIVWCSMKALHYTKYIFSLLHQLVSHRKSSEWKGFCSELVVEIVSGTLVFLAQTEKKTLSVLSSSHLMYVRACVHVCACPHVPPKY